MDSNRSFDLVSLGPSLDNSEDDVHIVTATNKKVWKSNCTVCDEEYLIDDGFQEDEDNALGVKVFLLEGCRNPHRQEAEYANKRSIDTKTLLGKKWEEERKRKEAAKARKKTTNEMTNDNADKIMSKAYEYEQMTNPVMDLDGDSINDEEGGG